MARQLSKAGYDTYVEMYNKKYNSFLERGLNVDNFDKKYSFTEWKYMYNATRNTLKEEVDRGNRKTIGNVNQYMVSSQAYTYTAKQAHRIKEYAATKAGQSKLTLTQIRAGNFDWDPIDEYYWEMKKKGLTGAQAKIAVSQYFFGSV